MQTMGTSPADTLNDEREAANRLIAILRQEQSHLISADIDGLIPLTEEKSKAVARMSELAARRYKALQAAGFEAGEAGMQAWLQGAAPAASASWNDLLALAQAAKELNRTNGLLIGKHLVRNQSALAILHGNPQGGNFYGPNGQATTGTASRSLVVG